MYLFFALANLSVKNNGHPAQRDLSIAGNKGA
jgi:hypothetical protein